eukprot:scaffold1202_cov110-Isochrysis_galbana.AAC.8
MWTIPMRETVAVQSHIGPEHGDAVAVGKSEDFGVVNHAIHVLGPFRINRPVEDKPREVLRALVGLAPDGIEDTVGPDAVDDIEVAKHLRRRHRLWVESDLTVPLAKPRRLLVRRLALLKRSEKRGKHRRLAGTRWADSHERVACLAHLEELHHLGNPRLVNAQSELGQHCSQRGLEAFVSQLGNRQPGEEVRKQGQEKGHIGWLKPGLVDIAQGAHD